MKRIKISLEIIKKPDENLPVAVKEKLNREITDLLEKAWPEYDKRKVYDVFLKLDDVILGRIDGELCMISGGGWQGINEIANLRVYRVGLTVVAEESKKTKNLRGKGLMTKGVTSLISNALKENKFQSFYIGFRTLEPVVYLSTIKNLQRVLPDLCGRYLPNNIEEQIALQISKVINPDCDFDEKKFVTKKAFSKYMEIVAKKYNEINQFKDERVKQFFLDNLNYREGDAFVVIAKVSLFYLVTNKIRKAIRKFFNKRTAPCQ